MYYRKEKEKSCKRIGIAPKNVNPFLSLPIGEILSVSWYYGFGFPNLILFFGATF